MTNQERKERRSEAARKAARTRRVKAEAEAIVQESLDRITDLAANGPDGRQLLARAQEIGREADLWYHAHLNRWPTRPTNWTAERRRNSFPVSSDRMGHRSPSHTDEGGYADASDRHDS